MHSFVFAAVLATQVGGTPSSSLPAHLVPLGRFEVAHMTRLPGTSNQVIRVQFPYLPPETSTQRNVKVTRTELTDSLGKPLEGAELITATLTSSEGSVSGAQWVWKGKGATAKGFKMVYTFEVDLYACAFPSVPGNESGSAYLAAVPTSDFSRPEVRRFFAGIKLGSVQETLADLLYRVSTVPYSDFESRQKTDRNLPAHEVALGKASDCGGQTNLFVAGSRLCGLATRRTDGFMVNQNGALELHVRAEVLIAGNWVPVEPTGAANIRNVETAMRFVGTNKAQPVEFVTTCLGTQVRGTFTGKDGTQYPLITNFLQNSSYEMRGGTSQKLESVWTIRRV